MKRYVSYEQIVDNVHDLIFVHDLDSGEILQANSAVEKLLGYSREELIGMTLDDIVLPEYEKEIKTYLKDVRNAGTLTGFLKVHDRGGSSHIMQFHNSIVADETGKDVVCGIARDITAEKRDEKLLRESERNTQLIFETLPAALYTVDKNQNITLWNREAERITGYTSEEIMGTSCRLFALSPCDRTCGLYDPTIEKPILGKECTIRRKDGETRVVYKNTTLLTDHTGAVVGGVESFIDITEKREAEKHYRNLVENLNDVIFNINLEGTITFISPVLTRMLGFEPDELIHRNFTEFIHPEDLPGLMESMGKTISGVLEPFEFRIRHSAGHFVHVRSSSRIIYQNEEPSGLSGVMIDITKRKEAEAQLQKNLHFLNELLDTIPAPVFYKDIDGRYLGYNKAFASALGYSSDEIVGQTVFDVLPSDIAEKCHKMDRDLYEQGGPQQNEFQVKHADDSLHDVIFHKAPFSGVNGTIEGLIGVILDITDQKQTESEQKHLNEILIERAAELKMSHQEITRLKVMAEEANRSKSEFLANMSHEIRTPMNGILGFAELLMEEELTEEQEEAVRTIYDSGHALLNLINDILDLSKVESGMMEIHEEEFFLLELLNSSMAVSRPRAIEKGLDYDLDIQTNIPTRIVCDQDKMRQILINLISNAVKFTESGTVTVSVQVTQKDESDMSLGIQVIDTGPGIPGEKLNTIFEPFTQADASSTKKYAGTGLGLSITKKLINLLDGDISVSSRPGEGSVFAVSIPISIVSQDDSWRIPEKLSEKILIVEDDPSTLKLYQRYLEKNEYDVVTTSFGKQALKLAREHMPCLIILDIVLPDISGWQVLKELKEDKTVRDIPVVIASILSEKNKAISLGAIDYIKKPISGGGLVNKIEKMIQPKHGTSKIKIMIVDDDEPVLEFLTEMLDTEGFDVKGFRDPNAALDHLKIGEQHPDIIILDIFMPEMDGFDVMSSIKEQPPLRNIPIIFITGREMTGKDFSKMDGISHTLLDKSILTSDVVLNEIKRTLVGRDSERGQQKQPSREEAAPQGSEEILVVEDNRANQQLIEKILTRAGYSVTITSNGQEALDALTETSYDLILMDMHMPVMDGYEAVGRIKGAEEHAHIPIVALTAQAMKGDDEKVFEVGCDGYLTKPVKKLDLLNEIRHHLGTDATEHAETDEEEIDERDEIFREFYATLPGEYEKIVGAAEKEDFEKLFHVGHDLKGSAGAFGLDKVSILGRQIEKAAKDHNIEHIRFILDILHEEILSLNDAT